MAIYSTLLTLGFLATLPKRFYLNIKKGKPLPTFGRLLGRVSADPLSEKAQVLWVHSVSVGETIAIAGLVKRLYEENPELKVVTSHATETGLAEAKKRMPFAHTHLLFPLDYRFVWRRLFARLKPQEVLICETDLWPNFLKEAKAAGAKISVVNGKISSRTFNLLRRFGAAKRALYEPLDKILVQNEEYLGRYRALGIPEEKLTVTGNLKIDSHPSSQHKEEIAKALGLETEDFVVTLGSTHAPEEMSLLKALMPLSKKIPRVKILVVPRHPERFQEVGRLLQEIDPHFVRLSEGHPSFSPCVLIDKMGVLTSCYALSSLAIVCGTFNPKVGGHNMLEPLYFGVPTLFGPSVWAQKEFADLALKSESGVQGTEEALAAAIEELASNPEKRALMGERGRAMIEENRGAKEKTFSLLAANVSK